MVAYRPFQYGQQSVAPVDLLTNPQAALPNKYTTLALGEEGAGYQQPTPVTQTANQQRKYTTLALGEEGAGATPPAAGSPPIGTPPVGGAPPPTINSVDSLLQSWFPGQFPGSDPATERQAAREARVSARNLSRGSAGTSGWKPINFTFTGQSHTPGAGTGQYYPGTVAEDQNRVRQQALAAFQQYAQRNNLPYAQRQAMSAQIAGGGGGGGFGGGGGGGGGGMLGNLAAEYQRQQDAANKANEKRYQDLVRGFAERYMRGLTTIEGMGAQERADINRDYDRRGADINQQMVQSGLTNTNVRQNMLSGNLERNVAERARLEDRLRQQRLSTDAQLSGDLLGVIERRDDVQPDFNQLLQLSQMLGAAGGGGGGGGGSMYGGGGFGYGGSGGFDVMSPAALGFGSPFSTMLMPMLGGRLGARTNILDRDVPYGGSRTINRRGGSYGTRYPYALPAASGPRLPSEIPIYA